MILQNLVAAGALATVLAAAGPADSAQSFYLHPNDCVVFYGDSITEQRLYTMLTELYTVTRYPKLNVRFVHSGWGGDHVSGGAGGPVDIRLDRDVLVYHPTVMTIMLGMNDGLYINHTASADEFYYTGYRHIVDVVRRAIPSLRITAIEPSPFDDVTRPLTLQPSGYNAVLVNYGAWIRRYAAEANLTDADLNSGVAAMLRKANAIDPAIAQKIIPDRIHPALAGHLIMAEQLLKSWNARPIVSAVSIDAAHGKIVRSDFADIREFHAAAPPRSAQLVWTETDEALPLPFAGLLAADRDHTLDLAVRSSDVTEALNRQLLQITGLPAGRYELSIDSNKIGAWTEMEMANGVNLAILETPMSQQAMEVRDLTIKHIDIHQQRWRTVQVALQNLDLDHFEATLQDLDKLEADIVARQRAAAEPRPHVFQLAAVQ